MLYALGTDGIKISPRKGATATCAGCGARMIPKCGTINMWHWAHESVADCDAWSDGESDWHLRWKNYFEPQNVEVTIQRGDETHRADVLTPKSVVIELQHSPISVEAIQEREAFYGDMVWVFDMTKHYETKVLDIYMTSKTDGLGRYSWHRVKKSLQWVKKTMYWDLGIGKLFKPHLGIVKDGYGRIMDVQEFVDFYREHPKAQQITLF